MPRPNAPWCRKARDAWFVKLDGRTVALGVSGKANRREAALAFARLLAGARPLAPLLPVDPQPVAPVPVPQPVPNAQPARARHVEKRVRDVVALALASCGSRVKPRTHERYAYDAGALVGALGSLPAPELTPARVAEWLHATGTSDTTKAIMLRSVSAVLGRAVALGLLGANPARAVPRPRSKSRATSALVTPDDHAKLVAAATPELGAVLRLLHATGARPGEVCSITAENFDAANAVVVLTVHKSDRTGKPRLIFLTPDAVALLAALRERFPAGPLLRSNKGVAWNARSVTQAMQKLRRKVGLRHAIAYSYRHAFATDALASGVPDAQVAALLGHTSTAVLYANYSHLTQRAALLRDAAARVRPAGG